jgi:hypothetical protein
LTTPWLAVIIFNVKTDLVMDERLILAANAFAETVIWRVRGAARGSAPRFKYRLALVVDGVCVLRYDNETGKGDHKHVGDVEAPYLFTNCETLLADFWADVENWRW